jgi:hypothetical protein
VEPKEHSAKNSNRNSIKLRFAIAARSAIFGTFCMAKSQQSDTNQRFRPQFEAQLWAAAGRMRGHMNASEYKHIVLSQQSCARLLDPCRNPCLPSASTCFFN